MATNRWIGNAPATYDLWTISLSGTVTSQTYSMTINGKSITYTAGGADSVAVILAALVSAWNASTIPEFTELSAAAATSSTIVLTGDTAGTPSVVSVSASGAATFSIAHTRTATGPNDFSNPLNWSTGATPANSDTLVFDSGSIDCKYNLNTALTGVTLLVSEGYSGDIGLPLINSDSSTTYAEYRTAFLTLAGGTAIVNDSLIRRCNLAFGANTAAVRILNTGQRLDPSIPVVLIVGGNSSSELDVTKGDVGVAFYSGTTATFPLVTSSYRQQPASDVNVTLGNGCVLTTINKNGGAMTVSSDVTTVTQGTSGGILTINAGAVTTLNVQGGNCVYNSTGTVATINLSNGAMLDFNQDPRAKTVTNPINLYGDATSIKDDGRRVNSGTLSVTTIQTTKLNVSHGAGNVCTFA